MKDNFEWESNRYKREMAEMATKLLNLEDSNAKLVEEMNQLNNSLRKLK